MLTTVADLSLSAADSARAVASVYTASLLAMAPIVAAIGAAVALRRSRAEARVLVWRAALCVLLIAFVGRALPWRMAGVSVPSIVAEPLIALGRIQVTDSSAQGGAYFSSGPGWIQLALAAYALGVGLVLLPTAVASAKAWRMLERARRLNGDPYWARELADGRRRLGVGREVRLTSSREIGVPMTWGLRRPVIVLPAAAETWTVEQIGIALRHELAHVRRADWAFGVAARLLCAAYWFHPGAWWIARSLRRDAEHAADDRVIASGVARSDYAELLAEASAGVGGRMLDGAVALTDRGSLRARLAAILDLGHDVRPLARRWTLAAAAASVMLAAPLTAVELAPTRDVLATLMRDSRWESRAYAVIGLAHRSDTVAVARSAAELDPSPRVRAWARYALGLRPEAVPASQAVEPR